MNGVGAYRFGGVNGSDLLLGIGIAGYILRPLLRLQMCWNRWWPCQE